MLPAVSSSGEHARPGEAAGPLLHRGSRYRQESQPSGPSLSSVPCDREAGDSSLLPLCYFLLQWCVRAQLFESNRSNLSFNPCSVTELGLHVLAPLFLHL